MVSFFHQLSSTDRAVIDIKISGCATSFINHNPWNIIIPVSHNLCFRQVCFFSTFIYFDFFSVNYKWIVFIRAKFTHSYSPNHSKNRNPREIPCLSCVTNVIELTRCTRSKATKRIWIFSSCPVWTAFVVLPTRSLFVVRLFYNHSHTPVKEYARPPVGIAGIEPATTRI